MSNSCTCIVFTHFDSQMCSTRNVYCVLRATLKLCANQQRAATESRHPNSKSIPLTVFLSELLKSLAAGYKLAIQLTLCLVREGAYGLENHRTNSMNAVSVALNNESPWCFVSQINLLQMSTSPLRSQAKQADWAAAMTSLVSRCGECLHAAHTRWESISSLGP